MSARSVLDSIVLVCLVANIASAAVAVAQGRDYALLALIGWITATAWFFSYQGAKRDGR